MVRRVMAAATVAAGMMACVPHVPTAPRGSHDGDTPVSVPYPPPPALVEMIPPRPDEEAVWVDGTFTWNGARYDWTPGGWERLVEGAYYAPPNTVRRRNGELLYYRGVWHLPSPAP
jgi:hypothetical protein